MSVFTKKIEAFAKELELHMDIEEHFAKVIFNMDEERTQLVLIYHYENDNHDGFVEITSPVLKLSGLPEQQLGEKMAEGLLRENDSMLHCQWAIDKSADEPYLIATRCWRLDQMDLEEFKGTLYATAQIADELESKLGVDEF